MKEATMPDEFEPPPDEPTEQPGDGARSIPDLGKPDDDTVYVDPLEAQQ